MAISRKSWFKAERQIWSSSHIETTKPKMLSIMSEPVLVPDLYSCYRVRWRLCKDFSRTFREDACIRGVII